MKFARLSAVSNRLNTMEIDVTPEQFNNWTNGMSIQDAMPNVPAEHREFLMTGITPEEWNEMYGDKSPEGRPPVGHDDTGLEDMRVSGTTLSSEERRLVVSILATAGIVSWDRLPPR